jgi:hypothetical protein
MPPLRMPHHATLCSSCLNCQSNFRLKVFLLFLTPTAVSFFFYSFFCFSHASVLPDFLNWLFTLPPLHMPPHATLCSSSRVPAVVFQQTCSSSFVFHQSCFSIRFQQSCSSSRVPAVVFQQSCSSSRVPAVCFSISCSSSRVSASTSSSSVIQQLCFSIHVPAVVFQHLRLSSRVPAVVFQHLRFIICDSAVVFQDSCSSSRVPASVIQPTSVFALVLQHLCSCFSNCVPASAIVFQLLCSNTCACSITNRLSSMTTLTICVSFCVPTLFQHCVSASVFAFVLQRLCFSFCVPASVLHTQSIAINDNLDHLRHLCCSHISNK